MQIYIKLGPIDESISNENKGFVISEEVELYFL